MELDRRALLMGGVLAGGTMLIPARGAAELAQVPIRIDVRETIGPLPQIWAECAGSDRAAITLRESWRHDLDRWHKEIGLKRVRCHGILNDELEVDSPSMLSRGSQVPNFQDVDRVYDGFLEHGVSPFIELSFMPKRLASGDRVFGFYRGNVTPPASLDAWGDFIKAFAGHVVERYGVAAVRSWPFEVWNEPNLGPFWTGTQQQYFDLYKATAVALKSVDPALQVGGPATATTGWISDFLGYCSQNNAPIDFVSTHAYAGDNQATLFADGARFPQYDVIPEAVRRARRTIDASAFAHRPLWLSEWSSDSPAIIAHVLTACLPHAHAMSHWVMSGTYEELGVANFLLKEGDMGFSTIIEGIAKPAFNTYKLLHALGPRRLAADGPALSSRRTDGSVATLVWNLADVKQPAGLPGQSLTRTVAGEPKRLRVEFAGMRPGSNARVRYVDWERGSPMPAWRAMGSPQYIKPAQIKLLRRSAEIAPPQTMRLDSSSKLTIDLPPEGVALIEIA
jgi:xylan 1,4-beta-xylosidase